MTKHRAKRQNPGFSAALRAISAPSAWNLACLLTAANQPPQPPAGWLLLACWVVC